MLIGYFPDRSLLIDQLDHNPRTNQSLSSPNKNKAVQDLNIELDKLNILLIKLKHGTKATDLQSELQKIYDWAFKQLAQDTQALLTSNLNSSKRIGSKQIHFAIGSPYAVLSAIFFHIVENLKVSTKEMAKLEKAIEHLNQVPDWGFLSLPILMQSNLWTFYPADALSAFYRIPNKLEELPGKYKYLLPAYRTLHLAFHLKHDISLTDNPADYITHLSNTKFILRNLRNGIHDSDLSPGEKSYLQRIQAHALIQLLQAMRYVLGRPTQTHDGELTSHVTKESLPYIDQLKDLIRANKDLVLDRIKFIQEMDNLHGISLLQCGNPWVYREFFDFPYEQDGNGKRITLDQVYLDPYSYKDFILRNRRSLPLLSTKFFIDVMPKNNESYNKLIEIIEKL